jgi:hypothetical protein
MTCKQVVQLNKNYCLNKKPWNYINRRRNSSQLQNYISRKMLQISLQIQGRVSAGIIEKTH